MTNLGDIDWCRLFYPRLSGAKVTGHVITVHFSSFHVLVNPGIKFWHPVHLGHHLG